MTTDETAAAMMNAVSAARAETPDGFFVATELDRETYWEWTEKLAGEVPAAPEAVRLRVAIQGALHVGLKLAEEVRR